MTSRFCINGTIAPETPEDFESILISMSNADIALGCFLIAGAIISTIPQHMKILKSKSAVGLSFLWLFLGNINQFATLVNAVVLKFPQIQACTKLGFLSCSPSLLSLFQLLVFWVFSFPFFCYFLYYTPTDIKNLSLENAVEAKKAQKELLYAKILFVVEIIFIIIISVITFATVAKTGECSKKTLAFGNGIGILSVVITFVQWSPQIYKTIKYKSPGSFSILMLCIQGPGTLVILYYFIFISKEYLSTWLSYLSAVIQLFIVLGLLIFYQRKDKKRREAEEEQEDDASKTDSSISPSGSLRYSDAHPLLKRDGAKTYSNDGISSNKGNDDFEGLNEELGDSDNNNNSNIDNNKDSDNYQSSILYSDNNSEINDV